MESDKCPALVSQMAERMTNKYRKARKIIKRLESELLGARWVARLGERGANSSPTLGAKPASGACCRLAGAGQTWRFEKRISRRIGTTDRGRGRAGR